MFPAKAPEAGLDAPPLPLPLPVLLLALLPSLPAPAPAPEAEEEEEEEEREEEEEEEDGLTPSTEETGRERDATASEKASVDSTEFVTALCSLSHLVCCSSVIIASANLITSSHLAKSMR